MRYFLEIAFFGKNYHGWQKQPDAVTVQETLENVLCTILRKPIEIIGAGRTDAGVHAKQIFAHTDIDPIPDIENLKHKINAFLPEDIVVKNIFPVKKNAHARFDATSRSYCYKLITEKNPFLTDFAYRVHHKPDLEKMNQAANFLLQYTDFQCFSKSKTDVKTYYCTIKEAYWKKTDDELVFTITADRFLRNMVRAIVGTLLNIGFGKQAPETIHDIIASKSRSKAGTSVPAHGLYLTRIEYPEDSKE